MFIEILFKMLLFKGGILIYAEHCSCWQPLYDELSSLYDIKCIEGIPNFFTDENVLPLNNKSILICDDLMEVAYSNDKLSRAFTKYVHHI